MIMIPSLKILFNQIKVRSKKKTKNKKLWKEHSPLINTNIKKPPLITSQFLDFKVVYLKTD